jgi:amylosucrase
MIAVRKSTPAFSDYNNRVLIATGNPHLFVFMRSDPFDFGGEVLVVGNFDDAPQSLTLSDLGNRGFFEYGKLRDLCSGQSPHLFKDQLVIPPYGFYWLSDRSS